MSTAQAIPPRSSIEVRAVGSEDFEVIRPLLDRFPTRRMTREDWLYTLFTHPWSHDPRPGLALFVDGRAVGFLGAIHSRRVVAGREERFCNPSSWIVLDEYRYAALALVRALHRPQDRTMVYLTPSPAAHAIFVKLGALPLEEEQLVLPPLDGPSGSGRALGGTFYSAPRVLRAELPAEERRIYEDHASSAVARHVLLRRGSRQCYVVATRGRKRGVPYAEVQYIGDRAFFWEHRLLAQAALIRAMGVAGLAMAIDRRFLVGPAPRLAIRWKMRRLYRPTRPEITPDQVDGLYSELIGLRL